MRYNTLIDFPVTFDHTGETDGAIGLCRHNYATNERSVTISFKWWQENKDVDMREQLIYHELGHCHFDRDHRRERFKDNCPKSLMMNNEFISKVCYDKYRKHYMFELPKGQDYVEPS
jgi:hypothetical protein